MDKEKRILKFLCRDENDMPDNIEVEFMPEQIIDPKDKIPEMVYFM